MSIKVKISALSASLILLVSLQQSSSAASPDDGYPEGQPAPGRTCPGFPEGTETISPFNSKTFVCTMFDGAMRWWIKGEALPANPSSSTNSTDQPVAVSSPEVPFDIPHTYTIPKKSLSTMKIFEDVAYSTLSPSQKLDLYLPKNVKNPPLLIWSHGGGFVIGTEDWMKFDDSAKLLEAMIKRGIAVASVHYRMSQEAKFPAAVSAVFELFGNADFDTMAANKIQYPCTVPNDPTIGQDVYFNPWFGDIKAAENRSYVESASLYQYLNKLKPLPKVFIFHGTSDCSVSQYDSIDLDKKIQALRGSSQLFLVPGEVHGGPKVWAEAIKRIPAFAKSF